MSRTLYHSFFQRSTPDEWFYSDCHQAPFNVVYEDKTLILKCCDCGKESCRVAVQEPLWVPEFKYEMTFRYANGKFHLLALPCAIRNPDASDEWHEESERQKYRMVFIPRERQGLEKLGAVMDYLS